MTVLDAQGLVAFLTGEPAEPEVRSLLREGDVAITAVNLAEAIDVAARVRGVSPAEVRSALSLLTATALRVLPCDEDLAWAAGELRAAHYDARRRAVSVADCFMAAAAEGSDRVATADAGVLAVARAKGIEVVRLRDSHGRRPR